MARRVLLSLVVAISMTRAAVCAEWLNISGTVVWSNSDEIPERPTIDTSKFIKHANGESTEVKGFGWTVDPGTRAVSNVVVYVKRPARIHPDFPQNSDETRKAFSDFFYKNVGVALDEIETLENVPEESKLRSIPSLIVLNANDCQPIAIAAREGQPVIVIAKNDVYNLQFYGRENASHFCGPQGFKSHYFSAHTNNRMGCLIHSWMKVPVSVFAHPYFAKTDVRGRFIIDRVPAGEVEVCACFSEYSIDLGSGEVTFAKLKASTLKINANQDIDLGQIVLKGGLPK